MDTHTRINDLGFISYLLIQEFKPSHPPENSNEMLVYFFKPTPELEQERQKYYSGRSLVDAFAFYRTLQGLKLQARRMRTEREVRYE